MKEIKKKTGIGFLIIFGIFVFCVGGAKLTLFLGDKYNELSTPLFMKLLRLPVEL